MPGICTWLSTSLPGPWPDGVFDTVHPIPEKPTFVPRMEAALEAPFDCTIVLDNDTRFVNDFSGLFDVLDRADLALAHAPLRQFGPARCPESYPAFNAGMIAFRRTPPVLALFRRWIDLYQEARPTSPIYAVDQRILQELLYESSLRVCVLPPEYNLRTVFPFFVGGRTSVKIVHGKEPRLTRWAAHFKGRTLDYPSVFKPSDCDEVVPSPSLGVLDCLASQLESRPRMFLGLELPQYSENNMTYGLVEMIQALPGHASFRVLELGSHHGVSTVEFLKHCASVHAVDRTCKPELEAATQPYAERFTFTQDETLNFLRAHSELHGQFDLVYLDDTHAFEHVCTEIKLAMDYVKPGRWLGGHDYTLRSPRGRDMDGALRAVQAMLGNPHYVFRDTSWIFQRPFGVVLFTS